MTTKIVLVTRRQITTTVSFMTVTCFALRNHLSQTVKKNLQRSLLFGKITGDYPITYKRTLLGKFFTFCNDIDGPSSQTIFNFVMHLDQQHRKLAFSI